MSNPTPEETETTPEDPEQTKPNPKQTKPNPKQTKPTKTIKKNHDDEAPDSDIEDLDNDYIKSIPYLTKIYEKEKEKRKEQIFERVRSVYVSDISQQLGELSVRKRTKITQEGFDEESVRKRTKITQEVFDEEISNFEISCRNEVKNMRR
jgi:hypothetical protein